MKSEHDIRVSSAYFELQAGESLDDDGPWRVSGVAVGEDSILRMPDGTPVLFSAEVLQASAESQVDQPVSVDHPSDDEGNPIYPPPTDETVGKVTAADYVAGKGLVYDAVIHDKEIAEGIRAGSYEVSVHTVWDSLSEKDEVTGAYKPDGTQFLDLSVVSRGMDPSNTAQIGPSRELTAWARENDITASMDASDEGTIQKAVKSTLRAMGIDPETTGAESPVDDTSNMRNDKEEFLIAEAGFDEETVDDMSDDAVEQTYQSLDDEDEDDEEEEEEDEDTGDGPLVDLTVEELGDALREQGFVTEEGVEELTAQNDRAEKVDEIIASSDDYDDEDREELMASHEKVIEREYDRLTTEPTSQLPGASGLTADVSHSEGSDDADEYSTGVAEH